ncbi:MAG: hypothetical protein WCI67_02600 [Chloroflexales bacterium]
MIFVGQVFAQSPQFKPAVRPIASEEMKAEQRWATAFANSQEALTKLAQRSRANYAAGNTEPLDPERL